MPALAEDLMQLLLDDESGRAVVDQSRLDAALAGAVLLELIITGKVGLAGPGEGAPSGHAVVRDGSATGDPFLDEALGRLARKPLKLRKATESLVKGVRLAVLSRLVERGMVRRDENRVLGIFRIKSWPAEDTAREVALRSELDAALLRGGRPDERIAGIIALLHAVDAVHKVVRGDKGELRARAGQIVEGDVLSEAVRKAVKDVYAAVVAAAVVVAAAAAAG